MLRRAWDLLLHTYREWRADMVPTLAAAMGYYLLVTLAPLVLVLVYVAGELLRRVEATSVFDYGASGIAEGSLAAAQLTELIENYTNVVGGYGPLVALGFVLVGATVFVGQFTQALDIIFRSEPTEGGWRYFVRRRIAGLAAVLVIALASLAASLAYNLVNALLSAFERIVEFDLYLPPAVERILSVTPWIGYATLVLLLSLAYTWLPYRHIRWRQTLPGAVFTALLYVVGQWGLSLYLSNSSIVTAWGAAGSFVALTIYIYYITQVLLFGAEFTRVWIERRGGFGNQVAVPASSGEA
ncbi:MAG: YihY/virulence factor BrkB family protein [Coriobacteriia bacterium]|nr:YihY/virulence factor BrkB family protein [Coriobacteriia bacterium]